MTEQQLTVFLTYTSRFDDIMKEFPNEFRVGDYSDVDIKHKAKSKEFAHATARYFNLCAEECYLAGEGLVDPRVWELWQAGLKAMLESPAICWVWTKKLRADFSPHEEFVKLVDSMLA